MQKQITSLMLFLGLLIAFALTTVAQNESNGDKYKYRALSEIVSFNKESTDEILRKSKLEEKNDFIGVDLFFSRVRLKYLGNSRPISDDHSDLIKVWIRLQRIDQKVASLYENEILVKECDREYWIPIQKQLSEKFAKEVKVNEMVTLFVIHTGGRKAKMAKEFEWLFLSTGFDK